MKKILSLVALAGCGLPLIPGDTITPVGPSGWWDAVDEAADTWALVLGDGCPRYHVGHGGHEVRFVPEDEWTHGIAIGYYDGDGFIEVKGVGGTVKWKQFILLHELGHGIFGPEHSDDPDSVMYYASYARWPTLEDVAGARAALGCE